jgi:hypothetical protein
MNFTVDKADSRNNLQASVPAYQHNLREMIMDPLQTSLLYGGGTQYNH